MRQVRIDGFLPVSPAQFWETRQFEKGGLSELDLYEQMTRKVDRTVLSFEKEGKVIKRHVKFFPKSKMPAIVEKALNSPFHYEEFQEWSTEKQLNGEKVMSFRIKPQMFTERVSANGEYFVENLKGAQNGEIADSIVKRYCSQKPLPSVLGFTREDVVELLRSYSGEWLKHSVSVEVDVRVPLLGAAIEKTVLRDVTRSFEELPLLFLELMLFRGKGGKVVKNEDIAEWRKANKVK